MSTPRDFNRPNLSKNQNPSDEKPTQAMKSQPKRHRRETRPAIAKRYKMDGGCL